MKASKLALDTIKHFEGCKLKTYICSAGKPTIGWGHTGADVTPGEVITQAEADALLEKDITVFEKGVNKLLKTTNQAVFDACVVFSYNCGLGALSTSTFLKKLKASDIIGASEAILAWDKADGTNNKKDDDGDGLIDEPGEKQRLEGLARRRRAERQLLLGKVPDFK